MRIMSAIVLFLAMGLTAIGCWGIFTAAGQEAFPEMAGVFPQWAVIFGVALGAVGIVLLIASHVRSTRRRDD